MMAFSHILLEAKSKYSQTLKPYQSSHVVVDSVDGFSHVAFNYNSFPPVRIKTKPYLFILKKKSFESVARTKREKNETEDSASETGAAEDELTEAKRSPKARKAKTGPKQADALQEQRQVRKNEAQAKAERKSKFDKAIVEERLGDEITSEEIKELEIETRYRKEDKEREVESRFKKEQEALKTERRMRKEEEELEEGRRVRKEEEELEVGRRVRKEEEELDMKRPTRRKQEELVMERQSREGVEEGDPILKDEPGNNVRDKIKALIRAAKEEEELIKQKLRPRVRAKTKVGTARPSVELTPDANVHKKSDESVVTPTEIHDDSEIFENLGPPSVTGPEDESESYQGFVPLAFEDDGKDVSSVESETDGDGFPQDTQLQVDVENLSSRVSEPDVVEPDVTDEDRKKRKLSGKMEEPSSLDKKRRVSAINEEGEVPAKIDFNESSMSDGGGVVDSAQDARKIVSVGDEENVVGSASGDQIAAESASNEREVVESSSDVCPWPEGSQSRDVSEENVVLRDIPTEERPLQDDSLTENVEAPVNESRGKPVSDAPVLVNQNLEPVAISGENEDLKNQDSLNISENFGAQKPASNSNYSESKSTNGL